MALILNGRIAPTDPAFTALGGCSVVVIFDVASDTTAAATEKKLKVSADKAATPNIAITSRRIQSHASARTDAEGNFEISIPEEPKPAGKTLRFVVSGSAGKKLGDLTVEIGPDTDLIVIPVDMEDAGPIRLATPAYVPQSPTRRINGVVLDRAGRRTVPANTQVLVFAQKDGAAGAAAAGTPIFVARTDVSGYFFGDAPNETFARAAALVAGIADEIPITLTAGLIPLKLLLIVDLPEDAEPTPKGKDCDCERTVTPRTPSHDDIDNAPETYSTDLGVGRCVQFNTPNRAIEEFDFYSVVRTTEPDIVGFTTASDAMGSSPESGGELGTVALAAAANAKAASTKATALAAAADAATKEAAAGKAEALVVAVKAALTKTTVKNKVRDVLLDRRGVGFDSKKANGFIVAVLNGAGLTPPVAATLASTLVDLINAVPFGTFWSNDPIIFGGAVQGILDAGLENYTATAEEARAAADLAGTKVATTAKSSAEAAQAAAIANAARDAEVAERARVMENAARERLEAQQVRAKPPVRAALSRNNPIDWDDTPTFYQAAEIAHGHLLHFKQVWYADGYSLGDLLYSLPLAPGQKKFISVVDWERRERTERSEDTSSSEGVQAALSRDRDLGEVVSGALSESSRGGSKSTSVGVGVGTGAAGNGSYEMFNFGALVGVSGGYGGSDSSAWQDSARNLSGNSLQTLRDRTLQSASAVRGLRSSVVHTVAEGEAVRATTEVVANHNHCHAMTVQYFEVLRHLKLEHKLTDVQECLFVPLPMTRFDLAKALRWRQSLQTYLQRKELAGAFEAARRVQTNWTQSDAPLDRYADESVKSISGEFLLTITIPLPPFPERPKPKPPDPADVGKEVLNAVNPTDGVWGVLLAIGTGGASLIAGKATEAAINVSKAASQGVRGLVDDFYNQPTPQERYDKFQHEIMPGVVEGFVDQLELWALVGNKKVNIKDVDFTLVSTFQPGIPLMVAMRGSLSGDISRGAITQLIIQSSTGVPSGCKAIINTANIRYRTSSFEHSMVDDNRVNDDIDPPKVSGIFNAAGDFSVKPITLGTGATLFTPLDSWEQRSPRTDDRRLAAELVEHLNNNFEYYHHAIWWTMDPNRRYMLLDGYFAPGSGNRSVASVVENRVIGIVGNSIVLPVARGVHLNPRFVKDGVGKRADLLDFYKLESPVPASRVSLPTRGVFAEAVLGACNSCEEIDDSRFWRWEESPIDEPPAINPVSTDTRRTDPATVTPTPFPTPIVSIQNAPAAPDPAGVNGVLTALGKQSFPDITGLAGTQANAAAAYKQALDTAFKFGKEASTLAQQAAMINQKDKALGAINKAEEAGQIDKDEAKQLRVSALKKMVGETPTDAKAASVADRLKVIDEQEAKGGITSERATELREQIMHGLDPEGAQQSEEQKATTETIRNIPPGSVQSLETTDSTGATTKITAQPADSWIDSAELNTQAAAELLSLEAGEALVHLSESPFFRKESPAKAVKRLKALFGPTADATAFESEVKALKNAHPDRATFRYGAALAGATPPMLVGQGLDDMICIASMSKLGLLYAAFQLKEDVETIVTFADLGTEATDENVQAAINAVPPVFRAAQDPDLAKIGRTPSLLPVLERIFDFKSFLKLSDADKRGGLKFIGGDPDPANRTGNEDEWSFDYRLKQALTHSNNDAATSLIADIGLPYIKALLKRSGLADISGVGKGLWLATTFGYYTKTWPARAGRSVTAGVEERTCLKLGSKGGSGKTGQGGTVRAVATFYQLVHLTKLVNVGSISILEYLDSVIAKPLLEGLAAENTVKNASSKVGILLPWYHDSALIMSDPPPAVPGVPPTVGQRAWIAVVLLSKGSAPIEKIAPELERTIENYLILGA